ncbi:MAG: fibronectin type III domain-containing protein [Bacteroidales bacterium]|jgi:hypothetical protein|nr:fibronectin type III domain-containing protein [Bacteroidales bacterium]
MYITNDNGLTNSATFLTSYGLAHRNIAMLNVNFTTANQFNIDFDYRDKGGTLKVYLTDVDFDPLTTASTSDNVVLLGTYTGSTQWKHATLPLNSSYSNTFKKIIFFWNNTYSWGTTQTQPPAAIDNLAINPVACGMQTNLTLVSKDTSSATISWHDANNAGSYLIAYSTDSVWNYQTSTDTLYTINGLTSGVSYNVKVAALCSANDTSLFTNIINFYTDCSYEDIPYLEDFATNVKSSPCWMFREGPLAATTTFSTGTTSYWNYKSTPKSMVVNIYGTSRNEWMITPSINLGTNGNTYQLEFDASLKKYSYNDDGGAPDVAAPDDKFAVVISRDNGLTWSNANAYVWASDGSTTRNYHAFGVNPIHVIIPLYDSTAGAPINGIIKIGFYGESTVDNDDNNLYIDNVAVNPWSECQKPTFLAISNITTTSAQLSFTENGGATSWEYAISDDSTMNPSTATNILTSTTNPIDITSLNPATQYYVAVRSVCTSSNAEWSPIISFKTIANPATLPYLCDFEDATENPNWIFVQDGQVNKWYIGTDTANSVNNTANGSNGLYVSNDGGSSYTYSMSTGGANGVICYAFRDFIVPQNATQLALSFDWKAKGYNATGDFLRFFVVNPDSTTITAGQMLSGNLDNDAQIGNFNGGGQHWLNQQTTWQHKNFIIDVAQYPFMIPGDTIRLLIQWRVVSSYGSTQPPAAVDNISLSALTCPSPSALTVNSTSSTELTATWTGTASNYEVTCVNGGTTQRFYTANSTYTINNLTPATAYTITVKAICSVGDTSFATSPVVGVTACIDGAISSFPWIESFEGGLNCWNQEYVTGTTDWNTTNTHYTATDGTHYADFYSTEEGDQTRLVSPTLNITTLSSPYLKFKHAQEEWFGSQDTLGVYYKADASSSWTYLTSFSSSITDWQTDSVALPNGSATYQIAFFGHSEYGHGVAIDEVQVYNNGEVILTEPTVATLAATNVNATTATLNGTITAGTNPITASGFEYRPTTSTTYTNIATSSNGTVSANVSNLTNNTQYTFRCYATTSVGTVYGDTMTFTTLNQQIVVLPSVTTDSSNAISASTAKLYATITIGTEPITQQGFMVKAVNDAEFTTNSGSVVNNQMTTTLVNLLPATTYTYKAFVSTADTTIYGVEKTFTTVSGIAGVENNSFVVSLYPNPTQGDATLNVEGLNENANIIITDVQGRLVSNQAMKAGQKTLTINRNNLTSGVYYVRVVTSSATRTQKLIIK